MHFILVNATVLMTCFTHGEELTSKFEYDFSADKKYDFTEQRAAVWQNGVLKLGAEGSISQRIAAGQRVRVEFDLEWPTTTERQEIRLWFVSGTMRRCFVQIIVEFVDDGQHCTFRFVDAKLEAGKPVGRPFRESMDRRPPPAKISIEYRYGLVTLECDGSPVLVGHVDHRSAQIASVRLTSVASGVSVKAIKCQATDSRSQTAAPAVQRRLKEVEELTKQVVSLWQSGRSEKALPLAISAHEITNEVLGESADLTIQTSFNLAAQYKALLNFKRAEEIYVATGQIWKELLGEWHPNVALTFNNLAVLYDQTGQYSLAAENYQSALRIQNAVYGKNSRLVARTLSSYAWCLANRGDYVPARESCDASLRIRKLSISEDPLGYASGLNTLGRICELQGDGQTAIRSFRKSLEITQNNVGTSHPAYAATLHNLAWVYARTGDALQAEELLQEAVELARRHLGESHPDYASSLTTLGNIQLEAGQYDQAEKNLSEAKTVRHSLLGPSHPDYFHSVSSLADLYLRQGRSDESTVMLETVTKAMRTHFGESHPAYANALHNLAASHFENKNLDEAEALFRRALQISESAGPDDDTASTRIGLAKVLFRRGELRECRSQTLIANRDVRRRLDLLAVTQSERQQAQVQTEKRDVLDLYISAAVSTEGSWGEIAGIIWAWKGSVTRRQRSYRKLLGDENSRAAFEELQEVSRQLSVFRSAPEFSGKEDSVARKSRLTNWKNRRRELTKKREAVEARIADLNSATQAIPDQLTVESLADQLPDEVAYVDFFEYQHLSPEATQFSTRYVAIVVQGKQPVRLVTINNDKSLSELITAFRRSIVGQRANRESIEASIQLRRKLWEPIEQQFDDIQTVIISPDTVLGTLPFAALPGRRDESFLIEDYRISVLPMANLLLQFKNENGRVNSNHGLLVVGDINYSAVPQSLETPSLFAKRAIATQTRSIAEGQWSDLPGFAAELKMVNDLYSDHVGKGARVLSGTEATARATASAFTKYRNIHIITHGYFSDPTINSISQSQERRSPFVDQASLVTAYAMKWNAGLLSGIVLSGANSPGNKESGILSASEIESITMPLAELVVLSACETGLGAVAGGEGLTGLQRAFHVAGARSVIASLWKVDDRATQELMRRFYTNLWVKKQSKGDALRNAQLWMLRHPHELEKMGVKNPATRGTIRDTKPAANPKSNPSRPAKRTSPYFWAPWVLSGDWR